MTGFRSYTAADEKVQNICNSLQEVPRLWNRNEPTIVSSRVDRVLSAFDLGFSILGVQLYAMCAVLTDNLRGRFWGSADVDARICYRSPTDHCHADGPTFSAEGHFNNSTALVETRRCRSPRCIAPIVPALKAALIIWHLCNSKLIQSYKLTTVITHRNKNALL